MKILIDDGITNILEDFKIVAYTMDVDNSKKDEVELLINNIKTDLTLETILKDKKIKAARDAYKALKKDPSHTRCAVEALTRRVIKDNKLYRLGDIIDIGNIISILTKRCICVVDTEKIVGDVLVRVGRNGEVVCAISRDSINATNLIVYTDDLGIFGSPTSDSIRTKITETTKNILVMMICFSNEEIKEDELLLISMYKKYTNARNIIKVN